MTSVEIQQESLAEIQLEILTEYQHETLTGSQYKILVGNRYMTLAENRGSGEVQRKNKTVCPNVYKGLAEIWEASSIEERYTTAVDGSSREDHQAGR